MKLTKSLSTNSVYFLSRFNFRLILLSILHVRIDEATLKFVCILEELSSPRLSVTRYAHSRDDGGSQLVRLGYMLMSIVIASFDITLDAFLAFLRMLGITLLGVNAACRCHLLDANARTGADADAARRTRCRRRRRRRLVALFISQTAQEALVNRLWRGL